MGTTLVISPHLDDAALSIGGSMAAWTVAGERVVVATVFTAAPPLDEIDPAMRRFADYDARRAEDARACRTLGAEVRWLGQIERAFRRPFPKMRHCFTTPPDRAGFAALPAVAASLATLDALTPDRILVPLGIGHHVDHVATLIAATDWAFARGWHERLTFYEDFYALSTRMRRGHPIARQRVWPAWRAPLWRAGRLAAILGSISLARRGPPATAFLAPELPRARWSVTPSRIDEERQLASIEEYASQTIAFGGMPGIARALRAYHAWWCGEPLWRSY